MTYPQQTQSPLSTTGESGADALQQSKHAASDVAQSAGERAQEVKQEAARQARDLVGEARNQMSQQAGQQQHSLATNLRSLSSELGAMAHHGGQTGVATELAQQAQQRLAGAADWLERREPGDVLSEVRNFARRRPGTFLLTALAAGVVAGRLTRGAVEVHTGGNGSSTASAPPAAVPSYEPPPAAVPSYEPPPAAVPSYEPLP
jgi:hypothetical protein